MLNRTPSFFMTQINFVAVLLLLLITYRSTAQESSSVAELLHEIEEGQHSVGLYERLGHTYYQEGDVASARLYYEKALLLRPRDKKIIEAIDFLKEELQVQITHIPDFVLIRYYRHLAQILPPWLWSMLQLLFALGIIYFSYRYLLSKPKGTYKRLELYAIGSFVLLTLICGLMAHKSRTLSQGGVNAIVMDAQSLYSAPDDRSEVVTGLGPGNKVELLDSIEDWTKVQLADKDIGWIKQELLKEI